MGGRYPGAEQPSSNVVPFTGETRSKEISDEEARAKAKELMPRGLTTAQKRVWNQSVPELVKAGRTKRLYQQFLRQYVITVARMDELLAYLDEHGWHYVTAGRNGTQRRPRPEAAQFNDDWRKWNSMVNQMGGSPATDARFNDLQLGLFDDDVY